VPGCNQAVDHLFQSIAQRRVYSPQLPLQRGQLRTIELAPGGQQAPHQGGHPDLINRIEILDDDALDRISMGELEKASEECVIRLPRLRTVGEVRKEEVQLQRRFERVLAKFQRLRLEIGGEQIHALIVDLSEFAVAVVVGIKLNRPSLQFMVGPGVAEHVTA
jgi:hypothetical protein